MIYSLLRKKYAILSVNVIYHSIILPLLIPIIFIRQNHGVTKEIAEGATMRLDVMQ